MARQSSYSRTRERLEEIVTQIKAKDIPLEKSLDLYEEALRLGSSCAEQIDQTDFSAEELESARPSFDADGVGDAVPSVTQELENAGQYINTDAETSDAQDDEQVETDELDADTVDGDGEADADDDEAGADDENDDDTSDTTTFNDEE